MARELTYDRRFREAADEYRSILTALGPKDDEEAIAQRILALSRLGDLCYLELSDPKGAAEAFRRLIAEAPTSEESHVAREKLADIAERHFDDVHEAIAQWQALAATDRPGTDRFAYLVAKGYFALNDLEQCRKECSALASRYPHGDYADEALYLAASTYQFEAKHAEAILAFEQLIKRWPHTEKAHRAHFQIGRSQAALGENDAALSTYLEVLKTHPDPQRVQTEIAHVRKRIGEEKSRKIGDVRSAMDLER